MEMEEKVARMQEIERRGLLDRLTPRQRAGWEEYKRRHNMSMQATPEQMPGILTADTIPAEALAQIDERDKAYEDKSHMGWNVAGSAVTGYGEGIENMTNRFVNGLTFGGYDWLDRHGGNEGQRLNRRIHQNAKNALGTVGDVAISAGDLGAEIGGNIYPGAAITRGLARAGVKSALGQAAAGGGIGGALYGATASDKLSDLPVNTIVGGVGGTVGGAALHSAISGIGTVGGLFRSNVKKGMDYIRKTRGDEYLQNMIDEATQKGVSLAEVADERGLKMVQMARQQTSAADDIITQNAQAIRDNVPNKNTDTLNDMFGTKSGYQMAQEAEQAAMEKARPMFNELEAYGDLDPLYVKAGEKVPTGKLSKEQADALLKQEMGKLPTREQLASYPAEISETKVVNERGVPLKVYHGTNAKFDIFDKSMIKSKTGEGILGDGFYFTDNLNTAEKHAYGLFGKGKGKGENNVKEVYLNIKNPAYSKKEFNPEIHDGIILKNSGKLEGLGTTYFVKEPEQIISADKIDNIIKAKQNLVNQLNSGNYADTSSLGAVVNSNNVINSAIKSVKGAYSSLKELPDTDARVILETRKLLSRQTKSPDATLAFQAKQALKEFDDALPADFRKGLEEANKIYKDNYQFSEAKESASDVFKANVSPEEFSDKFGKMTAEEKRALRGGLRDELFSIIENRANETLGWNRVVPRAVQSKIRRVMGVEEGNKLIEYAQGQLKSMRNLNKILGGSQTSEKQGLRDNVSFVRNIIKRPVDTLTGLVPYANARNKGIAELMTNPSADLARSTYEQAISPQGWEAVYQALYNPRGFTRYNTALAAYLAGRELQQ